MQITSLCQQLAFCHSVNAAADTPLHLELTSTGGAVGKTLKAQLSGVDNWPVTLTEGDYLEAFVERKEDLVGYNDQEPPKFSQAFIYSSTCIH